MAVALVFKVGTGQLPLDYGFKSPDDDLKERALFNEPLLKFPFLTRTWEVGESKEHSSVQESCHAKNATAKA
jgi:hypothetical protein